MFVPQTVHHGMADSVLIWRGSNLGPETQQGCLSASGAVSHPRVTRPGRGIGHGPILGEVLGTHPSSKGGSYQTN